jgi:hypothetical protein
MNGNHSNRRKDVFKFSICILGLIFSENKSAKKHFFYVWFVFVGSKGGGGKGFVIIIRIKAFNLFVLNRISALYHAFNHDKIKLSLNKINIYEDVGVLCYFGIFFLPFKAADAHFLSTTAFFCNELFMISKISV